MKNLAKKEYTNKVTGDYLSSFFSEIEIVVESCSWYERSEYHETNKYVIDDFEIIYVYEGEEVIKVNDCEYILEKNDMMLFEPFVTYELTSKSKKLEYYYIHFEIYPIYLRHAFVELLKLEDKNLGIFKDVNRQFESVFKQGILESKEKKTGYKLIITQIVRYLFLCIIRETITRSLPEENKIEQIDNKVIEFRAKNLKAKNVDEATRYIYKNINEKITIKEIAKELNITENYLYKSFIDVLDISPSKYITDQKIKLAIQLMANKNNNIKEIAYILGYSSPFHFSKTFKLVMHVSPSVFMKNLK